MDRFKLSLIDEELESSEVAALRFLCRDVVNRKRLEDVSDAKKLFLRLEEKGLLDDDFFLAQLLQTINRADLLSVLETDSRPPEETDANPMLSDYRVTLYKIHENVTQENLEKMKFLLNPKLGRRQTEMCNTALDVFAEMEKIGLLSNTNMDELHKVLLKLDRDLARTVENYTQRSRREPLTSLLPHVSIDHRVNNTQPPPLDFLSISETQPSSVLVGETVCTDAEISNTRKSLSDLDEEYYILSHNPRGWCVVINNENFTGPALKTRKGTQEDTKALREVFTRLGFKVVIENDLTAQQIRDKVIKLGRENFLDHDALVVCVLSHGEKDLVYGTDECPVNLKDLKKPFTSDSAPTLAGKPKLFFIQACQGNGYQRGALPCPPRPRQEEEEPQRSLEEDAGPVHGETVPSDCDFLVGMATVPECKSFRNTATGSIYIQELCRQLMISAGSPELEDINSVLIRVNREVSKGVFLTYKQMPQPYYTLTKRLVLKFI
ncbi:caspase-8-like isoform X2 [Sphaeramia orbicularis]|uniref:caspase-8-like isoform X2 n=1 Tax=Sphaeramia orbicularis TaxID=375764 RepID=UPI001180A61F|nr:caspase-8-like isoform X2 [Sphaeramia orbicularis]